MTAANVHDTVGGKYLLDDLAARHPSVVKVWADGGYQSSIFKTLRSLEWAAGNTPGPDPGRRIRRPAGPRPGICRVTWWLYRRRTTVFENG